MKVTLDCKGLHSLIKSLKPLKNRKYNIPIIQYAKMAASDDGLTLEFTDLDTWVNIHILGGIDEPGEALIEVEKLDKLLAGKTGLVEISGEASKVTYLFDSGMMVERENDDPVFFIEDYPPAPELEEPIQIIEMAVDDLVLPLKQVKYAVHSMDSRHNLNAIYVNAGDVIATDGHRLEKANCPQMTGSMILNKGCVSFLTQKGVLSGNLYVNHNEGWVYFTDGDTSVMARKVEGTYPDYKRVIPESGPTKVVKVDRKTLLAAIKEFSAFTSEKRPGVDVTINGAINISYASSKVSVDVELIKPGEEVAIIINRKLFEDAVRAGKTKTCDISYYKEGSPIIITSDDQFSLVMPMRK